MGKKTGIVFVFPWESTLCSLNKIKIQASISQIFLKSKKKNCKQNFEAALLIASFWKLSLRSKSSRMKVCPQASRLKTSVFCFLVTLRRLLALIAVKNKVWPRILTRLISSYKSARILFNSWSQSGTNKCVQERKLRSRWPLLRQAVQRYPQLASRSTQTTAWPYRRKKQISKPSSLSKQCTVSLSWIK